MPGKKPVFLKKTGFWRLFSKIRNRTYKEPRMKKLIPVCVVAFAFSLVVAAASSTATGQDKKKEDAKAAAKNLFKKRCAGCHARDGKGTRLGKRLGVPNFTDPKWQKSKKDEQLVKTVTNGRKRMPKFGGRLTKDQITALVKECVRGFNPSKKKKDGK